MTGYIHSLQAVGDRVFVEYALPDGHASFVEVDAATGKQHPLGLSATGPLFSTDGQQFVFGGNYGVYLATLAAPTAPATKLADGARYTPVLLHHDMAYFLGYTYQKNDDRVLYRVPTAGGTPEAVTSVIDNAEGLPPPVALGNSVFILSESTPLNLGQIGDGRRRTGSIIQIDVASATPHIVQQTGFDHALMNSFMPRSRNLAAYGEYAYVVSEDGLVRAAITHSTVEGPPRDGELIVPNTECPNMEPTFAVDADGIYVHCLIRNSSTSVTNELRSYDLSGKNPRVLATRIGRLTALATTSKMIVGAAENGDDTSTLFRVAK